MGFLTLTRRRPGAKAADDHVVLPRASPGAGPRRSASPWDARTAAVAAAGATSLFWLALFAWLYWDDLPDPSTLVPSWVDYWGDAWATARSWARRHAHAGDAASTAAAVADVSSAGAAAAAAARAVAATLGVLGLATPAAPAGANLSWPSLWGSRLESELREMTAVARMADTLRLQRLKRVRQGAGGHTARGRGAAPAPSADPLLDLPPCGSQDQEPQNTAGLDVAAVETLGRLATATRLIEAQVCSTWLGVSGEEQTCNCMPPGLKLSHPSKLQAPPTAACPCLLWFVLPPLSPPPPQAWARSEVTGAVFGLLDRLQHPPDCTTARKLACQLMKYCESGHVVAPVMHALRLPRCRIQCC
jgi:hypothetical protein